jgi:hypothetical protein
MSCERVPGLKGNLIRGLEAASTAHLTQDQPTKDVIVKLTAPSSFKQERLVALINLTGKIVPNFENNLSNLLINNDRFPIKSEFQLPSFQGCENTIFVFEPENPVGQEKKVLRINKASIGMREPELSLKAIGLKAEYEKIKNWYFHLPGFIPDENIFIAHSHLFKLPAVASITDFIPGKKTGIFEDYSKEELIGKLNSNPLLKEQFIAFGDTMVNVYLQTGECIDLVGEHNVSIVTHQREENLIHYDPHVIFTEKKMKKFGPIVEEKFWDRFKLIEEVLSSIKPIALTESQMLKPIPVPQISLR